MAESLTIDNYPIEANVTWALAQEDNIKTPLYEGVQISNVIELAVFSPSQPSYDILFETHIKAPTLAYFTAPVGFFNLLSSRLFSSTLFPGLFPEKHLEDLDEIAFQKQEELSKEEKEKFYKLKEFFYVADDLDKMLKEIYLNVLKNQKG